MKIGRKKRPGPGAKRYKAISATSMAPEIKKSTKLVIAVLTGITSRGETFYIMLEFETRLFPLSESVAEKNCQGNIPQNTRIG